MEECDPMGPVFLQAPLQGFCAGSHKPFMLHAGFPLTNLLNLLWLSIQCRPIEEELLLNALPQMKKLHTLDWVYIREGCSAVFHKVSWR